MRRVKLRMLFALLVFGPSCQISSAAEEIRGWASVPIHHWADESFQTKVSRSSSRLGFENPVPIDRRVLVTGSMAESSSPCESNISPVDRKPRTSVDGLEESPMSKDVEFQVSKTRTDLRP